MLDVEGSAQIPLHHAENVLIQYDCTATHKPLGCLCHTHETTHTNEKS